MKQTFVDHPEKEKRQQLRSRSPEVCVPGVVLLGEVAMEVPHDEAQSSGNKLPARLARRPSAGRPACVAVADVRQLSPLSTSLKLNAWSILPHNPYTKVCGWQRTCELSSLRI